ncbi:hypothetical protein C7477_10794 [Phyllobacterium leguminum]|uniref:Uncharacterized protein n=1 Tax=Phyllobacterium leguminum TaxID=314237 RepID=A0A318T1P6_9HYPH|nr:hypothetical protein C7477_10794 [Phyllobacterium leguminum]
MDSCDKHRNDEVERFSPRRFPAKSQISVIPVLVTGIHASTFQSRQRLRTYLALPSMKPPYPFTRRTSLTQALSFNCEMMRLRCFKSQTSMSMIISVKSGAVRTIDRL